MTLNTTDDGIIAEGMWKAPVWVMVGDGETVVLSGFPKSAESVSRAPDENVNILFVFPNKFMAESAVGWIRDHHANPGEVVGVRRLTVRQFASSLVKMLNQKLVDVIDMEGAYYPLTRAGFDILSVEYLHTVWQDYYDLKSVTEVRTKTIEVAPAVARLLVRATCFGYLRLNFGFFDAPIGMEL